MAREARGRRLPVAALALLVAVALLAGGCTSSRRTTGRSPTVRASAQHGGLVAHVTATAAASRTVRLVIRASDASARGALGTDVAYGDGTTLRTARSALCLASPVPRRRTWHLSHRYAHPGSYVVRVRVQASCSPGAAVVRLRVTAG